MSLLLGNDLVGGKVVADPKVTSKPITSVSTIITLFSTHHGECVFSKSVVK